ncbi:MAG TPA: hypothetical protein VKA34_17900 [Balneolales bacterium]|nr:hypothetical protein [Balneolales bacterium]
MKLLKVLSKVNQIEKISFLKILDSFCAESRKITPQIDQILTQSANQLKNVDDANIVKLFNLLKDKYESHIEKRIKFSNYQLDIIIEIFVRDGNQMMSREWFNKLYNKAVENLKSNIKTILVQIDKENFDLSQQRKRDYTIYRDCVKTAYENDLSINRDQRLSWEEKTVLYTLSKSLGLSNEEERSIAFSVVPLEKHDVDDIIGELKEAGIIFYNRKSNTLFVPDEIIWMLRDILEIEIPNKYLRRILRHLTDPEINLIARRHNIDRKLSRNDKIKEIIEQGMNVTHLLTDSMFSEKTMKADRAKRIQNLMVKDLEIELPVFGRSLEDKVENLIKHFKELEKDDKASLSRDGFDTYLKQLEESVAEINNRIKEEFELQDEDVMSSEVLTDYNIGPRDVSYLMTRKELVDFCKKYGIKSRGNLVYNIINSFRNITDLYLENFECVGCRDIQTLKEKGLSVRENELGSLYEKLTKDIFKKLGFNVDEKLRIELNTPRAKMDILLNLGGKNIIIVECKSIKDKDYNKYTNVSRQLKSYQNACKKKGYHVSQVVIVSNEFSEDFISECEYDYELSISLITSDGLVKILEGLKESTLTELPVRLLLKDGILNADRIVNVLNR